MALAPVVAGVADHNGWAVFVCVSVKYGSPVVIDRRRVELIEPGCRSTRLSTRRSV